MTPSTPSRQPFTEAQLSAAHTLAKAAGHLWAILPLSRLLRSPNAKAIHDLSGVLSEGEASEVRAPHFNSTGVIEQTHGELRWLIFPDGSVHLTSEGPGHTSAKPQTRFALIVSRPEVDGTRTITVSDGTLNPIDLPFGTRHLKEAQPLIVALAGQDAWDRIIPPLWAQARLTDANETNTLIEQIKVLYLQIKQADRPQARTTLSGWMK